MAAPTLLLLVSLSLGQADAGIAADPVSVNVAFGRGVTVSKGDALSFTLRGRLQLRDVLTVTDGAPANELAVRTARVILSGKALSPHLSYFLQLALAPADFETTTPSPLFDAYVDWTAWRDVNLRVGQFFVPFDRARTIREFALQLVDRQQVVQELNLDRDIGLMISSSDLFGLGGRLSYALGLFGGQGRNRAFAEPTVGFLYTARVTVRPLGPFDDDIEGDLGRSPTPHLAIGGAFAFNQDTWRQRSTLGTTLQLEGFDYFHAAGDLVFKWRGFSLLAEVLYRQATVPMHEGLVKDVPTREYARSGWGYLVQAGFMVTSQLEVAARWDQLRFLGGDPALATLVREQGRELGLGVNLYLNGHLAKVQADYALRFGEGRAPVTHLVRAVLDVSF